MLVVVEQSFVVQADWEVWQQHQTKGILFSSVVVGL